MSKLKKFILVCLLCLAVAAIIAGIIRLFNI